MNPENVLVVALLALLWLTGLVASWLKERRARRRRLEAQGAEDEAPPLPLPPRVILSAGPPWLPPESAPAPPPRPAPPPPPARPPSRFRLKGATDMRRAYVLMAVLGPPRALEPEDPTSAPTMR